jgi:hypothetical protein
MEYCKRIKCLECGAEQSPQDIYITYMGPVPVRWCDRCLVGVALIDQENGTALNSPYVMQLVKADCES